MANDVLEQREQSGAANAADVKSLVQGHSVMLSGRLASMTREQFKDLVQAHGGTYTLMLGRGTRLLVVGQGDWPLTRDGRLRNDLRRMNVLQRRMKPWTVVLTEEQFLVGLGHSPSERVHPRYTVATLTELLGVSRDRVRAWVKAGLVRPTSVVCGVWYFDFRQVSAAKTLVDLHEKGVTIGRLRRSIEGLKRWLPEADDPLQQLALLETRGPLLARLERGELVEADGQLHLDFTDEAQVDSMPLRLEPQTADQWLDQGVAQEREGYLAEAAESYRRALRVGGPDPRVSFNLANVLLALGQREQAVERFRHAVEADPQFSDAWNNLGGLLCELGRPQEACEAFREALAAAPDDARALYNLADTLDEMGLSHDAARHFRDYLSRDADSEFAAHARRRLKQIG